MFDRFRFSARLLSLPAIALLAATIVPSLHAAVQNRITASLTAEGRTSLDGTVAPRARLASDLGAADPKLALTGMTMHFGITDAQQAALTELLLEQQQPASANYHKWLTPEQFGDQFGLSTGDIAKVTTWLTSQGFTVTGTARSRNFITFSGTAALVEQAFGTSIHNVSLDGEKHFANLSEPTLPSALATVVSGIGGLHNFKLLSRVKNSTVPASTSDAVHPQFTSSSTGNIYVAPADFYTIYDENSLLANSINGSGITIAVMGQTDISLADVAAFRSAAGLSANVPTVKIYGNDPGTSTSDLPEAQLDVEWSGAVAPSASILYVNSSDVIGTSLINAIADNLAPIMTVSYGNCESAWGTTDLKILNLVFQQANAQGITVFGPAGDAGAADCDYQVTKASLGLAVDFPASSPFVTGVGGTMFNDGTKNPLYWAATNTTYNGSESALSYIPEMVWNETATYGSLAAGGGGLSAYFAKPAWQVGNGVPNDSVRDVPDVSLNAASVHEGSLICASGSCVNGFRTSATATTSCTTGGCLNVVGGTSIATPEFAGLLALVEQKNGGSRLGNINPTIYGLANSTYYSSVFHDITTGNNTVPCFSGTTGCPTSLTIGYSAGVGYDVASGWGTVDAYNLVNDWKLATPTGQATTTTLTPATSTVVVGTTITFTATVASSVSGSSTPTGTAQFYLDGSPSGSAVTLVSGSATYALSTTGFAGAGHTVSVSYSGDSTYIASTASSAITITGAGDFTIAGSATTLTLKAGASGSVTYTLTSLNNFIGTVTIAGSGSNSLSGSFSAGTVTLAAGGSGTTILTLGAYVANAATSTGNFRVGANRTTTPPWVTVSGGMALASMLLIIIPGRRRRKLSRTAGIFCVLLLSITAIGMSGCGGSSGLSSVTSSVTNTPVGSYPITVTGTVGSTTHTATLTLIVQ